MKYKKKGSGCGKIIADVTVERERERERERGGGYVIDGTGSAPRARGGKMRVCGRCGWCVRVVGVWAVGRVGGWRGR